MKTNIRTFLSMDRHLETCETRHPCGLEQNGFRWRVAHVLALLAIGLVHRGNANTPEFSTPKVLSRGAHEAVWSYVQSDKTQDGKDVSVTNSFTQLATGLNRWNAETMEWIAASDEIEIIDGKGVARKTQHQATFAANANDIRGAVELVFPGGKRMVIQTIGIAITDPDTGESTFLGEIQDSAGVLVERNTILWPDAFDGIKADIRIQNRLSGIESDVILRERIDRGMIEALGFNPDTARIEAWHEILENPKPEVTAEFLDRAGGKRDLNHRIDFGGVVMPTGKAFAVSEKRDGDLDDSLSLVAKEWTTISGVDFLIEGVPFLEAEQALAKLPARLEARRPVQGQSAKSVAASEAPRRKRPVSLASRPNQQDRRMVAALVRGSQPPSAPAYVLDYITLNTSQTDYTFKGNETYYINDIVALYGTTTLEGGAVIKYSAWTNVGPGLQIYGAFDCQTVPYAPAVFTSYLDNSAGAQIDPGNTNSPSGYYGFNNLSFEHDTGAPAVQLHDIRSSFGISAITIDRRTGTNELWNLQLLKSQKGIDIRRADVTVQNALIQDASYAFVYSTSANGKHAGGEHITIHDVTKIYEATSSTTNCTVNLLNSIAADVSAASATGLSTNVSAVFTTDPGLFQTVGRGACYLASGSPYRDYGSTNVSPRMAQLLAQSTTYPPIERSGGFSVDTTLTPAVQRDSGIPDLGYHYQPLDYLWGNLEISASATLTLTNGVAIGVGANVGTYLRAGARVVSDGSPLFLNRYVAANTVQEQPQVYGTNGTFNSLFNFVGSTASFTNAPPEIRSRFTEYSMLGRSHTNRNFFQASNAARTVDFEHCTLRNLTLGNISAGAGHAVSLSIRNSLLERVLQENYQIVGGTQPDVSLSAYNNLFRNCTTRYTYQDTATEWAIYDNLYVGGSTTMDINAVPNDKNAFYQVSTPFGGAATTNYTLATLDFEAGDLGPYYYPTNGTGLFTLVDNGSRNATNAGLYHFTVHTSQAKEAASTVDIGMHYAALSGGVPADSDSDGVPDYAEDANGNGAVDSGETNWQDAYDLGLEVLITQPKANSNIP